MGAGERVAANSINGHARGLKCQRMNAQKQVMREPPKQIQNKLRKHHEHTEHEPSSVNSSWTFILSLADVSM